MSDFIKSTDKIDSSFQDYGKDKIISIDKNGEKFGISIFGKGFVIDEVFTEILKGYDTDGNRTLDKNEALAFQQAIINAAGEDGILDKKELNRLLTKSENTTELSEKNTALFKALIVALKNGPQNFKTQAGYSDDEKIISSVKDDGSGVKVQLFETENGAAYRIEFFSNSGKIKELITSTNRDFREGENFAKVDENITTHIIYNDEGKVSEQSCIYKGDKQTAPYSEFSSFEYDTHGNLTKRYDLHNNLKTKEQSNIITYYDENGNVIEKSVSSLTNGLRKKEVIKYNKGSNTVASQHIQREKADVIIVEEYYGENIVNRLGHLPSKMFIYDKETGKLKSETINKFNNDGILTGKVVMDKTNNTKKEYDYSSVNGILENSYQGEIGNCFFLSTLNTLNTNEKGQKIINNTITQNTYTDEKGNEHTIYKVKFEGADKIKEDLSSGIRNFSKEKIFIQSEYTITEEELKQAEKEAGKNYSSGDKDVLLQEIAYSKYRKDVASTMRTNNESFSVSDTSNRLIAGLDVARGWGADTESMADGGMLGLTMYLYTGQKSDIYISKSESQPVCKIDSNGNLSVLENSKSSWQPNFIKEESNVFDKRYDDVDTVVKMLKKDTKKDGTFKNYMAEVSLSITSQTINGQDVQGGNHAFTIKGIKDNKVILINPWDSTKEVTISIEDFMKSAKMINILKL